MSKVNRGKQFEQQIRKAFEEVSNTSVYRLQDSMGGYAGVANICDFIVYHRPIQYFIECKCHYDNTLPFSCITTNQWQGMLEMSKIDGVVAGVMVWYIDHGRTYFVPVQVLERLKNEGQKSLNIKNLPPDVIEIQGSRRQILYDYSMYEFFVETENNV